MFKKLKNILFIVLAFSFFLTNSLAYCETNNDKDQNNVTILENALNAAILGPTTIPLIDQASIDIPENYLYIPKNEAAEFMHSIGNNTNQNFIGLIVSRNHDWFITINFITSGYIRDNEAKNWNADDLLKSLKDGTEQENKERVRNGFLPLHIVGWIEAPTYNPSAHQLVWSMLAKENDSLEPTVNYNTYALGRYGYLVFNLVTTQSTISKDKLHAKNILSVLHFNNNKSYEDFVEGKDKVAAYGIGALVTGIIAKKMGLLALIGAFCIKMSKFLIFIPVLLGSKIKNLFHRNKKLIVK